MSLRDELRALPTFPDDLPVLDERAVPDDPRLLFEGWLRDAIAAGERQPNAMTVTTVDETGTASSRTLIVKDVDERGLHFSSSRRTRKAAQLAHHPIATMLFFWRPLGRQVEITGPAVALDAETSAADWRDRPNYAGVDNPDWQVWALAPTRYEFLQATHDRRHVRIEYLQSTQGWTHARLRPSEQVDSGHS